MTHQVKCYDLSSMPGNPQWKERTPHTSVGIAAGLPGRDEVAFCVPEPDYQTI